MKVKKTITIDKELLVWIEEQIKEKRFASFSHAIECCVNEVKKKEAK